MFIPKYQKVYLPSVSFDRFNTEPEFFPELKKVFEIGRAHV